MVNDFNAQYFGRTLISPKTLSDIFYQQEKILMDPFHKEAFLQKQTSALVHESNVNCARLEAELMNSPDRKDPTASVSKKVIEDESRKLGIRVYDAWNVGVSSFKGELTKDIILALGKKIDPYANDGVNLRKVSANLTFGSAIDAAKLESRDGYEGYFDRFLREFNGSIIFPGRKVDEGVSISDVERAVYAHFMMFYLQPLMDGNKRTGRIIQNLTLKNYLLPPAIIYGPENEEYMHLMIDAFKARRVRECNPPPNTLISREEHKLFEYLGKKVLISLDKLSMVLSEKRTFYIEIDGRKSAGKELYMSAKHALGSLIRRRDPTGKVELKAKPPYGLTIRGDITDSDIGAVLDSIHDITDYRISPHS